jgi:hypothetical protein
MADAGVKLGSILFTLVEPHKGHEVAYNRWYERDHFYAGCLVGPGILAGARFVATRDLKALRYPGDNPITPSPDAGSYLALYWIERSMQNEWGTWAAKEVHRLHTDGRMFGERDHVHTKMYRYRGGAFADPDGVPPELALDRRYPGLVVGFFDAVEDRHAAIAALIQRDDLLRSSGAAMSLFFTAIPIPSDAPGDVPRITGDESRFLTLWFCESSPAEAWKDRFGALGDDLTDTARLAWISPFIPTIPGTDTYTAQLW